MTANLWHSCHVGTVEDFFAGRDHLRPLFEALAQFAAGIGPFRIEVLKTRISFVTRTRFASVIRLRRDGLVIGLWLKRRVESKRFSRVEHLERDDWIYELAVRSEDDLDDELRGWLAEAYSVGLQQG